LPDTTIKELLEAGAHFGHQTSRWDPRMKKYIFTKRNGIHIIDLERTSIMLSKAREFVKEVVADGGMPYINQRWIGGILTNFREIQSRIDYLVRLEDQRTRGEFTRLPKKEALKLEEEMAKMNRQLGGIKEMTRLPAALFVIDTVKERIALAEAKRMGIVVVAVADTNSNPDEIDHPVPANDDAIRAVKLVCSKMADAVIEGRLVQAPPVTEKDGDQVPAEGGAGLVAAAAAPGGQQ
jgi:small subunit ribosomal protein S2